MLDGNQETVPAPLSVQRPNFFVPRPEEKCKIHAHEWENGKANCSLPRKAKVLARWLVISLMTMFPVRKDGKEEWKARKRDQTVWSNHPRFVSPTKVESAPKENRQYVAVNYYYQIAQNVPRWEKQRVNKGQTREITVSIKVCGCQLVINIVGIKIALGVQKEGYVVIKEIERLIGHLKYREGR